MELLILFIGANTLLLIKYEYIEEPILNEMVSTRGDVPDFFDHSALTFKLMSVMVRSQEFIKTFASIIVAGLSSKNMLQHSEPLVAAFSAICLLTYQQKWQRHFLTVYTLMILLSCLIP